MMSNEIESHVELSIVGLTIFSHALIAPDPDGRLTKEEIDWLIGYDPTQNEPTWHRLYRIGRVDLLRAVNKGSLTWTEIPGHPDKLETTDAVQDTAVAWNARALSDQT